MKASLYTRIALIAVLGLGTSTLRAKDISFNDLPAEAKRVAQSELKSGTLKKVEKVMHNGREIFAITLQKPDGSPKYIYLEPNGTYVQDKSIAPSAPAATPLPPAAPPGGQLQLNQLPDAVQRTVKTELNNGPVSKIQQLPNQNAIMYQVSFQQPNGQEKVIYLNPDGSYVQNSATAAASATGTRSWDQLARGERTPLSASTKVNFNQLPAAVQKTFREEAGAAAIESIDRGTLNGQTVSEAAFKRNNQTVKLRVADDGTIIQDAHNRRIVMGGPLRQAKPVNFNQLPASVQNTLRTQAGASQIQNIEEGQLNGQTVYQASVTQEGQLVQIRVNPTGSVLSTSRAHSAVGTAQP